jgi:hypothetical protein
MRASCDFHFGFREVNDDGCSPRRRQLNHHFYRGSPESLCYHLLLRTQTDSLRSREIILVVASASWSLSALRFAIIHKDIQILASLPAVSLLSSWSSCCHCGTLRCRLRFSLSVNEAACKSLNVFASSFSV